MVLGLGSILLTVLLGPVLVKRVEQNIEIFFLGAGTLASAITGQWGKNLLHAAVTTPIALTIAVLVFGVSMRVLRGTLDRGFERLLRLVAPRWIYFGLIVGLGLLSGIITAVIAALVLVEAIALLKLDRVLPVQCGHSLKADTHTSGWSEILVRAGKVYFFVAGLVGLSWALRPLVDQYISRMPAWALFWINSISAIVDNATLAATEIGPSLTPAQQRGALMGLLISGGMLIPGNIPNIVAAGRLGITSREWARVGLLAGIPLMVVCFVVLRWIG